MFKRIKDILYINSITLLQILSIIISFLSSYYCSTWFNITINFWSIKINLNYFIMLNIIIFLIITYKRFMNKYINEFYIFIFWTLSISIIAIYYFSYVQSFLLGMEKISDYINLGEFIKIEINYTLTYKMRFFNTFYTCYVLYLNQNTNLTKDAFSFLMNFLANADILYTINLAQMSIDIIKQFTPIFIDHLLVLYKIQQTSDDEDRGIIYNLYNFLRNSFCIYIFSKIMFYDLSIRFPQYILNKFFKNLVLSYVKNTLLNARYVIFDMSKDEFNDLCYLLMLKLIKKKEPWDLLYKIISDYFKH